ncbi:DEKNAAC104930 [Brettanomyces naardenensis]|uniref:RNA polymerase II subunit A C-terminal domain phosphatase SSU72 n=1 Tax=Brettanomyces naardenensis TaxID=13370 RepID=A0A448YRY3_BRENA|nr:DEKNAAC104930 [Brettanomyces naardenensis]
MTESPAPLKFCTVCASNNNRSMEAHKVLQENGFIVRSYGTGSAVRLPGPTIDKPNVFPFGTPYTKIFEVLNSQDLKMHKVNGVIEMTKRNMQIKKAPERWPYLNQPPQRLDEEEHPGFDNDLDFQVVITCEERCFDAVVEDYFSRNYFEPNDTDHLVYCFNVDIRDDHESARMGGLAILELANMLKKANTEAAEDEDSMPLQDTIPDIIVEWQRKYPTLPILHALCYH